MAQLSGIWILYPHQLKNKRSKFGPPLTIFFWIRAYMRRVSLQGYEHTADQSAHQSMLSSIVEGEYIGLIICPIRIARDGL